MTTKNKNLEQEPVKEEKRYTLKIIFDITVGTLILIAMIYGIGFFVYSIITADTSAQQEKQSLCEDHNLTLNQVSGTYGECYKTINNSYYAIPIINVNGTYYLDMNRARVTK